MNMSTERATAQKGCKKATYLTFTQFFQHLPTSHKYTNLNKLSKFSVYSYK